MQRSTERFLCTHTGSLPRPDDLVRMMFAKEEGVPVEPGALNARIREAVAEVVKLQQDSGIDIVNDGELSKPSYATYIKDRLDGFGGESHPLTYQDLVEFPNLARRVFGDPGRARRKTPGCTAPVRARDTAAAREDAANLSAALGGGERLPQRRLAGPHLAFLPQRPLPDPRGLSRRYRRGDAPRIRSRRQRRPHPPDRLPRPRDGPAHPIRRPLDRRIPQGRRAPCRGAQPRAPQHPVRTGLRLHLCWGNYEGSATTIATCRSATSSNWSSPAKPAGGLLLPRPPQQHRHAA